VLDRARRPSNLHRAILRSARRKTKRTQHRPPRLWLERYAVSLSTLITNDFKSLSFAAAAPGIAKVGTASVTTGFAALRTAQSALAIILLFTLGKRKGRSAFGTGDLLVWHDVSPAFWFLLVLRVY